MRINRIAGLFFIVTFFIPSRLEAQKNVPDNSLSTPIPLEVVLGEESWTYQMIIDKKFAPDSRFGLFALSYLRADYDNDEYLRESLNLGFLKYDVIRQVSILSGITYGSEWGFRPYVGGQYTYQYNHFMGAFITGIYLTATHNYEALAMVEYRPHIAGEWSLYFRSQALYNQNTKTQKHDRSYTYGRLGLSYKTFSFGGVFNYDCYGPMKIEDHQWGIFISTLLK